MTSEISRSTAFEHVVSLGLGCPTAHFIQEAGLRRYAGPFDWTLVTPQVMKHCIDDNFADFLNLSLYAAAEQPGCWKNVVFEEKYGLPKVFSHIDLRSPGDWRYVEWTAERFIALMDGDDHKLLVTMHTEVSHPAFYSLFETIKGRTENAKILAVQVTFPDGSYDDRSLSPISLSENCDIFDFRSSSHWPHGLGFQNDDDNALMMRLFAHYQYNLKDTPD